MWITFLPAAIALHVRMLDSVLELLVWAAKEYNVQVFATTHSLEAIDAVIQAHGDNLEDLAAYRLSNRDGKVSVTRDSGASLKATRMEFGFEVR